MSNSYILYEYWVSRKSSTQDKGFSIPTSPWKSQMFDRIKLARTSPAGVFGTLQCNSGTSKTTLNEQKSWRGLQIVIQSCLIVLSRKWQHTRKSYSIFGGGLREQTWAKPGSGRQLEINFALKYDRFQDFIYIWRNAARCWHSSTLFVYMHVKLGGISLILPTLDATLIAMLK